MASNNIEILPASVFQRDIHGDKTEHLQWYGPGKLHPTHLGDALDSGRYTIAHKLDHSNRALSWLARDNRTQHWVRIDIVRASPEVTSSRLAAVNEHLAQRTAIGNTSADNKGLALTWFRHNGPNGAHLCIVFPLQGVMNCFRYGANDETQMNAAWFVRQCARLRAENGNGNGKGPDSVHDITEDEMIRVLGRPQVLKVDAQLRRIGGVECSIRPEQLPRYLVVRPAKIEGEELDFWLSPEAFKQ